MTHPSANDRKTSAPDAQNPLESVEWYKCGTTILFFLMIFICASYLSLLGVIVGVFGILAGCVSGLVLEYIIFGVMLFSVFAPFYFVVMMTCSYIIIDLIKGDLLMIGNDFIFDGRIMKEPLRRHNIKKIKFVYNHITLIGIRIYTFGACSFNQSVFRFGCITGWKDHDCIVSIFGMNVSGSKIKKLVEIRAKEWGVPILRSEKDSRY